MSHDLVIRDGRIVDGTGTEPYAGDIAIDGDTITAVGKVVDRGKEEIRADGLAVTPGFIDLHTHLDAQIGWDPMLTPISWHGVTTALLGNCGVTFAPCKPADRQFLAEMMETVEDIPREAILSGLPWNWESYGEYLDALESMHPAINVTGMVGHGAVRFYVMGHRGIDENPTADEIAEIARVAGQSVKDGAIGFSTNRLPGHRLPDGRSIPGTFAEAEELEAIAREVGAHNGLMQNVPWYDRNAIGRDLVLLGKQARAGGGRVLFSVVETETFRFDDPHQTVEDLRADGCEIYGVTVPRPGGFVSMLKTNIFFPAWAKLRAIDIDKRLDAIRDEGFRRELIEAAQADPASIPFAQGLRWMGNAERPVYTKPPEDNLKALADAAGEHPAETWLRLVLDSDGAAVFHRPFFNTKFDAVETLMQRDWVDPRPRRCRRPRLADHGLGLAVVPAQPLGARPGQGIAGGGDPPHDRCRRARSRPEGPGHPRARHEGRHQRARPGPGRRTPPHRGTRLPARQEPAGATRRRLPGDPGQRADDPVERRAHRRALRKGGTQHDPLRRARPGKPVAPWCLLVDFMMPLPAPWPHENHRELGRRPRRQAAR